MKSAKAPETAYEQGMAHLKRGEYERAVASFTEAIRLKPNASNAYAGRALAYRSLDDEASALRDEQTVRELGGVKPPAGEFLMLLTPDYHINQRMERPEQFVDFVKAVVDATEEYFQKFPPVCGLDLRVACAVLPQDKVLLEIALWPREQFGAIVPGLRKHLEALPRPKVNYGPVAFSSQSVVQGGSSEEHEGFGFPFASLMKPGQQGALDDLLMGAAGGSAESKSWWAKLKQVFGFGG
jgi:tetratricopeptide (TPR) repeat protein